MTGPDGFPVIGVCGLDHTADVGIVVSAPDLSALFERAARGSLWLVLERDPRGEPDSGSPTTRPVELVEEDLPMLMRSWLRAILLWAETEGFVATGFRLAPVPAPLCGSDDGQAFGLRGEVSGVVDLGSREREIKGVTFHGLEVAREPDGWKAQVIFDV